MLSRVDFPAPDGPMMVTNSPSRIVEVDPAEDVAPRGARLIRSLDVAQLDHGRSSYSARSAVMGSTRVARRAGRYEATRAVSASSAAIPTKVSGSVGLTR